MLRLGVVCELRRALDGIRSTSVVVRCSKHDARPGHAPEGWLCLSVAPIGRLFYPGIDSGGFHGAAACVLLGPMSFVLHRGCTLHFS